MPVKSESTGVKVCAKSIQSWKYTEKISLCFC